MKILRKIGVGLLVLVVILGVLAGYGIANTNRQLNATIDVPEVADIPLPTDEASLAEGQRLFQIMNCV